MNDSFCYIIFEVIWEIFFRVFEMFLKFQRKTDIFNTELVSYSINLQPNIKWRD